MDPRNTRLIPVVLLLLAACGDDPSAPAPAPDGNLAGLDYDVVLDRLSPPSHVLGALFRGGQRTELGDGPSRGPSARSPARASAA